VDKLALLVLWDVYFGLSLAEERDDGLARVTTNDRDGGLRGVLLAAQRSNKGLGTDDIEGGDTKEALRIEDVVLLENLRGDWDGAVYGVGDNEEESLGAVLVDTLDEITDNASVDLEQVVTGHAGLAWEDISDSVAVASKTEQDVRGMPAGMTIMSASFIAAFPPSSLGR
jgi:hypothetical protein